MLTYWRVLVNSVVFIYPKAEITFAFACPTITSGKRRLEGIKLVIKTQLFVFFNVPKCKYTNWSFSKNRPFSSYTVGIATMVDKSRNITMCCGVYDLTVLCAHHVGTRWILVHLNSFFANIRVNIEDISHVLHDKPAFCNNFTSCKAPPFITSLYRIHIAILV